MKHFYMCLQWRCKKEQHHHVVCASHYRWRTDNHEIEGQYVLNPIAYDTTPNMIYSVDYTTQTFRDPLCWVQKYERLLCPKTSWENSLSFPLNTSWEGIVCHSLNIKWVSMPATSILSLVRHVWMKPRTVCTSTEQSSEWSTVRNNMTYIMNKNCICVTKWIPTSLLSSSDLRSPWKILKILCMYPHWNHTVSVFQ